MLGKDPDHRAGGETSHEIPIHRSSAGRSERGDVLITVYPSSNDSLEITIQSSVEGLYGESIRESVLDVCREEGFYHGRVDVQDDQALDPVIRARVMCALRRLRTVDLSNTR